MGGDYGRRNNGTAWWLETEGPGPYDDPEVRPYPGPLPHRDSALPPGPPMLSTLYNNHKRIVQTPGHVMILTEMVHDARIVRMNGEHAVGRRAALVRRLHRLVGRRHARGRQRRISPTRPNFCAWVPAT